MKKSFFSLSSAVQPDGRRTPKRPSGSCQLVVWAVFVGVPVALAALGVGVRATVVAALGEKFFSVLDELAFTRPISCRYVPGWNCPSGTFARDSDSVAPMSLSEALVRIASGAAPPAVLD